MPGDLESSNQWGDPSRLRVSDADRHRVGELLREAAGEGRLDIEELEERLEAAYAAKTYGDLVPLTADLPVSLPKGADLPTPPPTPSGPLTRYQTSIAIMGSTDRTGLWEVGPSHTAVAIMGGVTIDLRSARFSSRETVINAFAFWAGVDIYVNAGTRVVVEGIGVMGAFDQGRDRVAPQLAPDAPLVRVNGLALMAGITVTRKPMPGERRRRRLRS
jgi:hypothetical protein